QGKPYQYVSIRTDITEKKLIEEALLESKERYESLYKHNINMVYTLDLNGFIMHGNSKVEQVTGSPMDELRGKSYELIIASEYLDITKRNFQEATRGLTQSFEYAINNREGQPTSLLVTHI